MYLDLLWWKRSTIYLQLELHKSEPYFASDTRDCAVRTDWWEVVKVIADSSIWQPLRNTRSTKKDGKRNGLIGRDWDHLYGHYIAGQTAFLTWDRPILDVAPELRSRLGVVVMKPEGFLSQLANP